MFIGGKTVDGKDAPLLLLQSVTVNLVTVGEEADFLQSPLTSRRSPTAFVVGATLACTISWQRNWTQSCASAPSAIALFGSGLCSPYLSWYATVSTSKHPSYRSFDDKARMEDSLRVSKYTALSWLKRDGSKRSTSF